MPQASENPDATAERANELYWEGSKTVDDIVGELGISRSSLYAGIDPLPAGVVCADCQERMVFTNRTARDRGVAECPNCGRVSQRGAAGTDASGAGSGGGAANARAAAEAERPGAAGGDAAANLAEALRAVSPQRLALVGGAAALGILAGAAAAHLLRE